MLRVWASPRTPSIGLRHPSFNVAGKRWSGCGPVPVQHATFQCWDDAISFQSSRLSSSPYGELYFCGSKIVSIIRHILVDNWETEHPVTVWCTLSDRRFSFFFSRMPMTALRNLHSRPTSGMSQKTRIKVDSIKLSGTTQWGTYYDAILMSTW